MGFVAEGGYVIAGSDRTLVHKVKVDAKTLKKIATALGISKGESEQLIATTRSIHIYRGGSSSKKKSSKKK
jgi:hypothetical protein